MARQPVNDPDRRPAIYPRRLQRWVIVICLVAAVVFIVIAWLGRRR